MSGNETSLQYDKTKINAEISPIVEMTHQMVHSFFIFKQAVRDCIAFNLPLKKILLRL